MSDLPSLMLDLFRRAGIPADAVINRSDFGMINSVPFIGEEVRLHIESEFVRE